MVKNDFWLTSGWHLLDKDDEGRLLPTEDFMRAYFYRPEVAPIEESCEAEIDIHKRLVDTPFLNICLLYTSPSPRDVEESRMPSSA